MVALSGFPVQFPWGFRGFPGVSRGFRHGMNADNTQNTWCFVMERGFPPDVQPLFKNLKNAEWLTPTICGVRIAHLSSIDPWCY